MEPPTKPDSLQNFASLSLSLTHTHLHTSNILSFSRPPNWRLDFCQASVTRCLCVEHRATYNRGPLHNLQCEHLIAVRHAASWWLSQIGQERYKNLELVWNSLTLYQVRTYNVTRASPSRFRFLLRLLWNEHQCNLLCHVVIHKWETGSRLSKWEAPFAWFAYKEHDKTGSKFLKVERQTRRRDHDFVICCARLMLWFHFQHLLVVAFHGRTICLFNRRNDRREREREVIGAGFRNKTKYIPQVVVAVASQMRAHPLMIAFSIGAILLQVSQLHIIELCTNCCSRWNQTWNFKLREQVVRRQVKVL